MWRPRAFAHVASARHPSSPADRKSQTLLRRWIMASPSFPRSLLLCAWTWLSRPSVWVGIITLLAYWDKEALHGSFVYDDAGSVLRNVVVTGQVDHSWTELWKRDYWGTSLTEISSHKSFRPVTTLTFKLNYLLSEKETYSYHIVNVLLHAVVTMLVTETAAFVFVRDSLAPLLTGLLFGLHPVHVEAVSNITSRGELLMSLFCLLAFLSYATHVNRRGTSRTSRLRSMICIYVFPFLLMALSLFSKEQGATTLITLVVFDFVTHHTSIRHYAIDLLRKRDARAVAFLRRTVILAIQTLSMVGLRYWFNGETSPDFIFDQNPAGFSEDRFTRVFSVNWVYCLYLRDAVYPNRLGPDWSGKSIDLITSWTDVRILAVLALWTFVGACLYSLFVGPPDKASAIHSETRRILLTSFWAFGMSPFLLSSNLLVVVGLMKADRVIYLPLLGLCMMEALLVKRFLYKASSSSLVSALDKSGVSWWAHMLLLTQVLYFCRRLHERNFAWSHSLRLWHAAYEVNPKSYHTMYNYGYELSLVKQFSRSEQVLQPIGSARVDGPSNTFVYAMVLYNLNRCDDANLYLEEAFEVLEERRQAGGPRNQPQTIARYESNLLVAKSYCAGDVSQRGQLLYKAVQVDQSNTYAVQQAKALLDQIQMLGQT